MNEDKATDIHDVKPSSLSHLIGNNHVRQQVQVALDSCFEDQIRFPDTLLCGPPGLGKSTWAQVIAKELAVELHETLGQAVSGPAEMNVLLLSAKDNELIHIDEVHLLPTDQQTTLFFCSRPTQADRPKWKRSDEHPVGEVLVPIVHNRSASGLAAHCGTE